MDAAAQQAAGGSPGGSQLAALLLHQRLAAAEGSAERANEELLQACQRAEAAQAHARKYHQTLEEMRVRTSPGWAATAAAWLATRC